MQDNPQLRPKGTLMIEHPTVATLKVGPWSFTGKTRHERLGYLPSTLRSALGRVPQECRSPYHGRCAEVMAIARALRSTAHLEGASVSAMKVRRRGNPKDGQVLQPCSSCQFVLEAFGIRCLDGRRR